MRFRDSRNRARSAFTLVELLTVIAIIGVLVSLLMAAVFKVTSKGEEVNVRSDISQLAQGIEAFRAKYSVKDPPPSRLYLAAFKAQYNLAQPLQRDSFEYLSRVWPRLAWSNPSVGINWGNWPAPLSAANPPPPVILEGHQCLVFFLGGIPAPEGCSGFSTNPQDPSAVVGDRTRFFDGFKQTRLATPNNQPWVPGTFYAFKDAYEKAPYAYFSSYKSTNGYQRYPGTDCSMIPNGPFCQTAGKFYQPDGFQIISAGSDGLFGPGGLWLINGPPQTGYKPSEPGYDDLSNFHDKLLGILN